MSRGSGSRQPTCKPMGMVHLWYLPPTCRRSVSELNTGLGERGKGLLNLLALSYHFSLGLSFTNYDLKQDF